jgi:hypothetical protein
MNTPATILETFAGPLELRATNGTHLYARSQEETGTPLLINRVPHKVQIYLVHGPGGWGVQDRQVFLSRVDKGLLSTSPSLAAHSTVLDRLVPAVIAWATAHPAEFRLAGAVSLAQALVRQEQDVARKTEELLEAQTTLDRMRLELADMERPLGLDVRAYAEALD